MVISEREATTSRFETCHLHDMMREICLLKAKEENFIHITNSRHPPTNFQSPVISHRIFSQHPTTLDVDRDINNPKLRSFVVVQLNNYGIVNWKLSSSSYKKLELLRVLDLFRAECKGRKLLSSIGKLIHLRYLSLNYAMVSHLPSSLGNLKLLIYLNLDFWCFGRKIFVPTVLKGMQELRYLALPQTMHEKTKLELSNLVKLESLKKFSTQSSSLEDLRGMVRLRTLKIQLYEETSMETLSASIGGLRYLETLSASIFGQRNRENLTVEDKANLMKGEWTVLDFVHLKNLSLSMYMPRLSKDQHFPSHLTTLSLWDSHLEEDPMPILEKLGQLKNVILSSGYFCGRRMVCSSGGFSQLHELSLCELEEWEDWIVEEGSMPLLHSLVIWDCPKLKELPDGLQFLYSLKYLIVNQKWEERWSEGGEDYYKVKHIPFLELY
ncbi:PREDICTED: putative disease resistance protein At1g58400 [Camelina sativa]|uniref:Disease resistance protein At1g58400 n=1 Tax=Camelina sativa TaxID=90675 RepID=A0ABM1R2M8_CAMSA|nr:PREDICTED: putative disease resistance protein At1g58400 [Camelina sativa]